MCHLDLDEIREELLSRVNQEIPDIQKRAPFFSLLMHHYVAIDLHQDGSPTFSIIVPNRTVYFASKLKDTIASDLWELYMLDQQDSPDLDKQERLMEKVMGELSVQFDKNVIGRKILMPEDPEDDVLVEIEVAVEEVFTSVDEIVQFFTELARNYLNSFDDLSAESYLC